MRIVIGMALIAAPFGYILWPAVSLMIERHLLELVEALVMVASLIVGVFLLIPRFGHTSRPPIRNPGPPERAP